MPDETISELSISKAVMMEAIAETAAGIGFLQWLVELTGWDRSMASNEMSARRDIWLAIRHYIPDSKLPLIEYENVKRQQARVRALLELEIPQEQNEDGR